MFDFWREIIVEIRQKLTIYDPKTIFFRFPSIFWKFEPTEEYGLNYDYSLCRDKMFETDSNQGVEAHYIRVFKNHIVFMNNLGEIEKFAQFNSRGFHGLYAAFLDTETHLYRWYENDVPTFTLKLKNNVVVLIEQERKLLTWNYDWSSDSVTFDFEDDILYGINPKIELQVFLSPEPFPRDAFISLFPNLPKDVSLYILQFVAKSYIWPRNLFC